MSSSPDRWPQDSDPAVSDPGLRALAGPKAGRYGDGVLVGRGGMGQVERVHDGVLGRDVARKSLSTVQPALAERLRREARLSALLDHPGIVPIYDFGEDPDTGPWYTMRLIRGRSLEAEAAERPDATMRLLPRLLQAAQAVAYAHGKGVIHRDLKPANIMLGPHGETLVVDWGLARRLTEAEPHLDGESSPVSQELTKVGAVIGTPAWMAPEQGRGEPTGPAADVWALGRILEGLLRGTTAPRDLLAIAARATEADPSLRYANAGDFATELEHWLAGRPVAAHDYTARESVLRFAHAFRLPLLIGAISAGVLVLGGLLAFHRVEAERDRALALQVELRTALRTREADAAEASLLGQSPGTAWAHARAALALGDSPKARAVIATTEAGSPRFGPPTLGPQCEDAVLSPDGLAAICVGEDSLRRIDAATGAEVWRRSVRASDVVFRDDGGIAVLAEGRLLLLRPDGTIAFDDDANTPWHGLQAPVPGLDAVVVAGSEAWVWQGGPLQRRNCATNAAALGVTRTDDGWRLWCSDGETQDAGGPIQRRLRIPAGIHPVGLAVLPGGEVAFGSLEGAILVFGADGELRGPFPAGTAPCRALLPSPDGRLLAALSATAELRLVDGASGAVLWDVDGVQAAAFAGPEHLLLSRSGRLEVVPLVGTVHAGHLRVSAGISAVSACPDGRIAVAGGDGTLTIFAPDGTRLAERLWGPEVLKDVAFAPDGSFVAATGVSVDSLGRARAPDYDRESVPGNVGGRAITVLSDGSIVAAPYAPRVQRFPGGLIADTTAVDLDRDASGRSLLIVGERPFLQRFEVDSGAVAVVAPEAGDGRASLAADGGGILSTEGARAMLRRSDGTVELTYDLPDAPTAVLHGGDVGWFGFMDGSVRGYRLGDGALVLDLRAHGGRVGDLERSADGATVWSASWDGTVRLFRMEDRAR